MTWHVVQVDVPNVSLGAQVMPMEVESEDVWSPDVVRFTVTAAVVATRELTPEVRLELQLVDDTSDTAIYFDNILTLLELVCLGVHLFGLGDMVLKECLFTLSIDDLDATDVCRVVDRDLFDDRQLLVVPLLPDLHTPVHIVVSLVDTMNLGYVLVGFPGARRLISRWRLGLLGRLWPLFFLFRGFRRRYLNDMLVVTVVANVILALCASEEA